CAPVERGLDTVWSAIEKTHFQHVLHVGNRFGDHGLRHRELLSRLSHAAMLSHGYKDVEIAQLETMPNPISPLHDTPHREMTMMASKVTITYVSPISAYGSSMCGVSRVAHWFAERSP